MGRSPYPLIVSSQVNAGKCLGLYRYQPCPNLDLIPTFQRTWREVLNPRTEEDVVSRFQIMCLSHSIG